MHFLPNGKLVKQLFQVPGSDGFPKASLQVRNLWLPLDCKYDEK